MKPNGYICYVRSFSGLAGLQPEHRVVYSMMPRQALWELRVERQDGSSCIGSSLMVEEDAVVLRSVMRYLYENAVSAVHWQDVVRDILPAEKIKGDR